MKKIGIIIKATILTVSLITALVCTSCDDSKGNSSGSSGTPATVTYGDITTPADERIEVSVGGTVEGLTGTLILQMEVNNSGEFIIKSITKNGSFNFLYKFNSGNNYIVSVKTHPSGMNCAMVNNSGTADEDVKNIKVSCNPGTQPTTNNTTNTTDTTTTDNTTNTTNTTDTTTTDNTTSTTNTTDTTTTTTNTNNTTTTTTTATPPPEPTEFTIGGTVKGFLKNFNLQLHINNINDYITKPISQNGTFEFALKCPKASTYSIFITEQPEGVTCTVSNNTGTAIANVTDIKVVCAEKTYSVGGSINGLDGTIILQNNGTDDLSINSTGSFTFSKAIAHNGQYNVTIKTQPAGQTCTVSNGTAQGIKTNISNINVTCSTHTFTIGGDIFGLKGTLILQNNSSDDLQIELDGSFAFETPIAYNTSYNVTVKQASGNNHCIVNKESGTETKKNINNISIYCLQKQMASDKNNGDRFGFPVALSGDTMIAGAKNKDDIRWNSGAAYIFTRENNTWTQSAKLTPSDATKNEEFGNSVAISGDTVIVGAHLDQDNGLDSGSAYIFTKVNNIWTQIAKLLPSDGAAHDSFGHSVAVSGDIAAVGAKGDDDNEVSTGSVYIFTKENNSWTQSAKLIASDGANADQFGNALSLQGNTIAVGNKSGAVYIFTKDGTNWNQTAKLTASDGAGQFGTSISLNGDTVAVGAYYDDDKGHASGSVFIFTRGNDAWTWTQSAKLTASDGKTQDNFGDSVSISGSFIVVGAPCNNDKAGSLYIFTKEEGTWKEMLKLTASDWGTKHYFGTEVSMYGNTIAITSLGDDRSKGAVFMFDYPGSGSGLGGYILGIGKNPKMMMVAIIGLFMALSAIIGINVLKRRKII